ncbi:MAG: hypothetical protein AVDCRST_MAG69-24, partial [uncultured Solirubrobacteraceae bacterium]
TSRSSSWRGSWPATTVARRCWWWRRTRREGWTCARRRQCTPACARPGRRAPGWWCIRATWTRCWRWPTGCWWCTTVGYVPSGPTVTRWAGRCWASTA